MNPTASYSNREQRTTKRTSENRRASRAAAGLKYARSGRSLCAFSYCYHCYIITHTHMLISGPPCLLSSRLGSEDLCLPFPPPSPQRHLLLLCMPTRMQTPWDLECSSLSLPFRWSVRGAWRGRDPGLACRHSGSRPPSPPFVLAASFKQRYPKDPTDSTPPRTCMRVTPLDATKTKNPQSSSVQCSAVRCGAVCWEPKEETRTHIHTQKGQITVRNAKRGRGGGEVERCLMSTSAGWRTLFLAYISHCFPPLLLFFFLPEHRSSTSPFASHTHCITPYCTHHKA